MHNVGCTSTVEILENWFYLQTGSTGWTDKANTCFERIAFLEKNNKINSASSSATKQQPTSTATATKTPEFPPISASAKFYTDKKTWTQVQRSEPVPDFNKLGVNKYPLGEHFVVLGVLCRSLYIDKANSIGTISSRRGSQRGGKWEAMDMFLRNFRPGSSSTRNKSKRTQILARKRVSNRMRCCSRGAIQDQSQSMLSSRKPRKQAGFQTGTCFWGT